MIPLKKLPKLERAILDEAYELIGKADRLIAMNKERFTMVEKVRFKFLQEYLSKSQSHIGRMAARHEQAYNYYEPSHNKWVDVGICTIRHEMENIRGWAKTMLYFCNEVYAIMDKVMPDDTELILRNEFPDIKIVYQFGGDSDDLIEGPKQALRMHESLNYYINELVDRKDWFLLMAADERFHPSEFEWLEKDLDLIRSKFPKYNGIYFDIDEMHQLYPDEAHAIDFKAEGYRLLQCKFIRLDEPFVHGLKPHSGFNLPSQMYRTRAQWYHYCFIKETRVPFINWRDQEYGDFPTYEVKQQIENWRDLPQLNNKGEMIEFRD